MHRRSFSSNVNPSGRPAASIVLVIQAATWSAVYALSRLSTGTVCDTSGSSWLRSDPTRRVGESSAANAGWSRSRRSNSSNRRSYSRSLTEGRPTTWYS